MKTCMPILCALLLALSTGCEAIKHQTVEMEMPRSTLINGTEYILKVYRNGILVRTLEPGEVMVVEKSNRYFPQGPAYGYSVNYGFYNVAYTDFTYERTMVSVTGWTPGGVYKGTDSWVYCWNNPQSWTVLKLH